jgi:hypothetical protein
MPDGSDGSKVIVKYADYVQWGFPTDKGIVQGDVYLKCASPFVTGQIHYKWVAASADSPYVPVHPECIKCPDQAKQQKFGYTFCLTVRRNPARPNDFVSIAGDGWLEIDATR